MTPNIASFKAEHDGVHIYATTVWLFFLNFATASDAFSLDCLLGRFYGMLL